MKTRTCNKKVICCRIVTVHGYEMLSYGIKWKGRNGTAYVQMGKEGKVGHPVSFYHHKFLQTQDVLSVNMSSLCQRLSPNVTSPCHDSISAVFHDGWSSSLCAHRLSLSPLCHL